MSMRLVHRLLVLAAAGIWILASGCGNRQSYAELLAEADAAYTAANYEHAAWIYSKLKKRGDFRDNAALRISLGSTYLKLGWLHNAGCEFSEAVELSNQTNSLAWLGLGSCYGATGDWKRAKLCFEHAFANDAQNPLVLLKLGTAYFNLGEYGYAIRCYVSAADHGNDSADLRTAIGLCYEQNPLWITKAAAEYEKAFIKDPQNATLARKLAVLYRDKLNVIPKAEQYYNELKRLDANLARQEAVQFEERLKAAVRSNPLFSASTPTGTAAAAGSPQGLLTQGSRAKQPKTVTEADHYESLAETALGNGLPKEALDYYNKALKADPKRTCYNRDIAVIYERYFRDLNLAIKHYDKYLESCKDDAQFETTLLYVKSLREQYHQQDTERRRRQEEEEKQRRELEAKRQQDEAARSNAFAQAQKDPQDYDGVLDAGAQWLQGPVPDLVKARDCFQKAIRINASYPNAYYNLGLVCVKQTNLAESIGYFSAALERDRKFADAHLALGMVYVRLNQMPDAIEHYNCFLELAPNSSYAEPIRAWLTKNAGAQ